MEKLKNIHEGKKYLIIDESVLDKVSYKFKNIMDIEKLHDTKNLIETDDKLPNDITLKNVKTLITCVTKNGDKLYSQIFLEKALLA